MPGSPHVQRQKKLAAAIQSNGFQLFALNSGPSLQYLTGLNFHLSERPVVFFFAADSAPVAVLPELEKGKLADVEYELRVHTYGEDPTTWARTFKNAALDARLDLKRVGIEPARMRVLELRLLENAAPRSAYVGNADVVSSLRMYKDETELDAMRRAVDVAERALEETLPALKEGVTEREVAAELALQMFRCGSDSTLPFSPIVAFGAHSANPHASPGDLRLSRGDLVLFDWGASVDGYASDLTRMFAYGRPDEELARITAVVGQANAAARAASRPGAAAGDIDKAAREAIEREGYGAAFVHRTGHGLGLDIHEEPYIRADNSLAMEVGMVFTVEPGIYLPGRGGARIEDDVVITADGAESLSTLPRELTIIES